MSRERTERRLRQVAGRLSAARADLRVCEEHLAQVSDEAEDSRVRALVSESPLAQREHRRTQRHADRLTRERDRLLERIARLESDQDRLLDRFTAQ